MCLNIILSKNLSLLSLKSWDVIDRSEGFPKDSADSHHRGFCEVVLKDVFLLSLTFTSSNSSLTLFRDTC
jgi:hypothetical protein